MVMEGGVNMSHCSSCNSFDISLLPDNFALIKWTVENNRPTVNPGNFFAVNGTVCHSCGHIDLKADVEAVNKVNR